MNVIKSLPAAALVLAASTSLAIAQDQAGSSWAYEAAVSLTGSFGNTERADYAASAKATLEREHDRFQVYAGLKYAEEDSDKKTDETILGASYTNFFRPRVGWYARTELERDEFENIDFRSTSAIGAAYKAIDETTLRLELTAGLSYRTESYSDDTESDELPGLDFGLRHYWKFAEWGEMNNQITYNPAFEDLGVYRLNHSSAVDVPLGTSDAWKLRVSLTNQYNSEPSAGLDKLDTTYAVSLLLNWK